MISLNIYVKNRVKKTVLPTKGMVMRNVPKIQTKDLPIGLHGGNFKGDIYSHLIDQVLGRLLMHHDLFAFFFGV